MVCKPGSVGVLAHSGRSFLYEYGRPYSLAAYPRCLDRGGHLSPHIWPCSSWGLPCRSCYHERGGLLLHRFTLAIPKMAVCSLWHCPSRAALAARAQELPGSLSTGARTFLELVPKRYQRATVRSFAFVQYNQLTNPEPMVKQRSKPRDEFLTPLAYDCPSDSPSSVRIICHLTPSATPAVL